MVRGFGRRDALGGRRDAVGVSGVSLVLLAGSQPRIAAQRAVCGRRAARVRPCVRRGALLPARTGARWCSAPRPRCGRVWASRSVSLLRAGVPYSPTGLSDRAFPTLRRDAAVGRCLLSNRMRRVSSSARIATSFDPSRRRRAVPVETCR